MKSLKSICLLLFFLPLTLLGQNRDTLIANKILNLEEVIPVHNKGFILFKTDSIEVPTVLNFTYFNLNNEEVSTISIPTSRTNELFAVEKIFVWNDKLIICSSLYQPGFRKNHLLYYEYSLPNLTLTKSEILLETIAPPTVYVPYLINLSPDSSKLITLGWNYNTPKEKAKIQANIFNKDLVVESQINYNFDFENQRIAIEDVLIDDNSNIYLTGNNYRGALNGYNAPSKLDHFVLGLFPNKESNLWFIKIEKRYFQQITYAFNKEQTLIGAGFWSKGLKSGIGLINIAHDSQTAHISTQHIDYKTFKTAYKKNLPTFSVPKNGFSGYDLKQVICKPNAYFVIGEHHQYDGEYGDILIIKLSKAGMLSWLSRIPKNQQTFGVVEKLASFKVLERKDKLYFLFNDSYLNYNNGNGSFLQAATLDAKPALAELSLSTGAIERKTLPKLLKKDYIFLPAFCQNISKEDVIIVGTGVFTKTGKFLLRKVKIKA